MNACLECDTDIEHTDNNESADVLQELQCKYDRTTIDRWSSKLLSLVYYITCYLSQNYVHVYLPRNASYTHIS